MKASKVSTSELISEQGTQRLISSDFCRQVTLVHHIRKVEGFELPKATKVYKLYNY